MQLRSGVIAVVLAVLVCAGCSKGDKPADGNLKKGLLGG